VGAVFAGTRRALHMTTGPNDERLWEWLCDPELGGCGKIAEHPEEVFRSSIRCRCKVRPKTPPRDWTGHIRGKLTVIGPAGRNAHGEITWACRCDCGTEFTATSGQLKGCRARRPRDSCGCTREERFRKAYLARKKEQTECAE
jgi:hypothetical protein